VFPALSAVLVGRFTRTGRAGMLKMLGGAPEAGHQHC
jgi:hypothetical protein